LERRDLVLLVDDDAMVRTLVRAALVKRGLEVVEAGSGSEGLAAFQVRKPDIILLDAVMPGMDGFTACRELRALPEGEHVPLVILTGLDDDESVALAYESGATDFFVKSPQMTLLAERIRYLLRTARMRAELVQSRAKLAKAQRIARLGSWEWEPARRIVFASEECCRLLGLAVTGEGIAEETFIPVFYPNGPEAFRFEVLAGIKSGRSHRLQGEVLGGEGARYIEVEVEADRDERQHIVRVSGTVQDVTERRRAEEEMRRLANYDGLTGLANRNLFRGRFEEALEEAYRKTENLAVLFIDLDRFKVVNDTLGHAAGDALLREVAVRLNGAVRSRDTIGRSGRERHSSAVARLGGDEFVILLRNLSDKADAARVAERVLDALRKPVMVDDNECWVGASIGIAAFPEDGASAEELLAHADAAMYAAKAAGRDGYKAYTRSDVQPSVEKLKFEGDLRKALEREELRLHWQPIIDVSTGTISGAEVLMRWQRGDKMISPGDFIPLAEETGLIIPMGEWALEMACRQVKAWHDQGLPLIYVGVNVTSNHVQRRDLLQVVRRVLDSSGLAAQYLSIEITETGMMDFFEPTLKSLQELRDIGVRIAIDDFGTGYSSLSYLKRLPVSMLKIDRSFVTDVAEDADDEAIVSAISGLARSLSLSVVAEGVETSAQRSHLSKHGVNLMQGYYFSRPVPPAEFEKLLVETRNGTPRLDWIQAEPAAERSAASGAR
jgi:diguanylate cyclase (GGDEF)-like protein